jgi:hypothetical protein
MMEDPYIYYMSTISHHRKLLKHLCHHIADNIRICVDRYHHKEMILSAVWTYVLFLIYIKKSII